MAQKITPSLWVETTDAMVVAELEWSILAAGPYVQFNESVSFVINTQDQEETDYYWEAL